MYFLAAAATTAAQRIIAMNGVVTTSCEPHDGCENDTHAAQEGGEGWVTVVTRTIAIILLMIMRSTWR